MKKYLPLALLVIIVLFFFKSFFLQGKLPIPADTIIGLYHPFRDLYAKEYPRGIPFKNFLITDPVRQQYPWRELSVLIEKKFQLPLWNPYNMAGVPLLGNFQSAAFYPLNLLLFVLPFELGWSILIVLQPLLAAVFLYLYLNNLKLSKWASILGSFSFAFSGFFVAWMEWGTVLHVGLWLSLILLSIDKIVSSIKYQVSSINRKILLWSLAYLFSLSFSLLAGHLQTFFYVAILSIVYFFVRWIQYSKNKKILFLYIILNTCFLIPTSIQWLPTFQFILESARDIDQVSWQRDGWFIPWQHLIQFIAPDFFGNPTTLNYWGIWNYGELVGYVGIGPLLMAVFALFFRRDKKTLFFGTVFFLSLLLSLPTIFAKMPFMFNIPFLSTAQPTRLLFITDFSLAVLAALGFDYFVRNKKQIIYPIFFIFLLFVGLWTVVLFNNQAFQPTSLGNIEVTKRNLFLPAIIFTIISILVLILRTFRRIGRNITIMIYIIIVGATVFDLMRFGIKFTPFTDKAYLFPNTKALSFLQKQKEQFRIMTTDSRILPPNFSIAYRLQSIDGYDPLYLQRYAELIAASERGQPNISPPFGFNRIITPHNYDSKIIDLLGVKYVLSLSELKSPKLTKVFQEGQTIVYENKKAFSRTFFVENLINAQTKEEAIRFMFNKNFKLDKEAVVEYTEHDSLGANRNPPPRWTIGRATVIKYSENKVVIKTDNKGKGFLVLTDVFYPTWRATIDSISTKIYRANYNFRGIFVPEGKHTVEFYIKLI